MLDASVLLMQQYSTVVANLPQNNVTVSTQTETRIEELTKESPISTTQGKSEPDVVPTTSSYKQPSPVPSTSKTIVTEDTSPMQPDTTTPVDTNRDKTDVDAADELRRRRLQKFAVDK